MGRDGSANSELKRNSGQWGRVEKERGRIRSAGAHRVSEQHLCTEN